MRSFFYLLVIIFIFCTEKASAQRDTDWVYMKNVGWNNNVERSVMAENKDSADFIRMITSPDTNIDRSLYPINDFYLNGKLKRRALSTVQIAAYAVFQGPCLEYYPDGQKKMICNFENGHLEGAAITYYPNGKMYISGSYHQDTFTFNGCSDSTGIVLAEDGNGKWIKYSSDFKQIIEQGFVNDGLKEGNWTGRLNDSVDYRCTYLRGNLTSGTSFVKNGHQYEFKATEVIPEFEGGIDAFGHFLTRNVRYPQYAREHKIQGRVIITFVVEKDGSLQGIKVARGVEKSLDDEAVRVIKMCPKWSPAYFYGIPVRVQYSVPINFTVDKGNQNHRAFNKLN